MTLLQLKIKRIIARLYWTYFIANFIHNLNTYNQHNINRLVVFTEWALSRFLIRTDQTQHLALISRQTNNINTYNQHHVGHFLPHLTVQASPFAASSKTLKD